MAPPETRYRDMNRAGLAAQKLLREIGEDQHQQLLNHLRDD